MAAIVGTIVVFGGHSVIISIWAFIKIYFILFYIIGFTKSTNLMCTAGASNPSWSMVIVQSFPQKYELFGQLSTGP